MGGTNSVRVTILGRCVVCVSRLVGSERVRCNQKTGGV